MDLRCYYATRRCVHDDNIMQSTKTALPPSWLSHCVTMNRHTGKKTIRTPQIDGRRAESKKHCYISAFSFYDLSSRSLSLPRSAFCALLGFARLVFFLYFLICDRLMPCKYHSRNEWVNKWTYVPNKSKRFSFLALFICSPPCVVCAIWMCSSFSPYWSALLRLHASQPLI